MRKRSCLTTLARPGFFVALLLLAALIGGGIAGLIHP